MSTTSTHRSPLRWPAAALLLVAAAAHVPLVGEHLHEAPYIGWGFLLLSAACVVLAFTIIVTADHVLVWALSAAVCVAALVGFLASRTIGLPELGDDVGNWTEPLSFPAIAAETALVALALVRIHATVWADRAGLAANPARHRP